jgi:hypothetical protein
MVVDGDGDRVDFWSLVSKIERCRAGYYRSFISEIQDVSTFAP